MNDRITIDLRPLLAAGTDPLLTVLESAASLPAGHSLVVEAPFDPRPMRRIFAGKGYSSAARRLAEGHWQVTFVMDGAGRMDGDQAAPREACAGPEAVAAEQREDGLLHLDLRGMAPPRPLVAVLGLCGSLPGDGPVVVHLDRDPLYLYPELAEIGWTAETQSFGPGEVVLRLCRQREGDR